MLDAKKTVLADALRLESERRGIAIRVIDDVLLDRKAGAPVRQASLTLIDWLLHPAEALIASRQR